MSRSAICMKSLSLMQLWGSFSQSVLHRNLSKESFWTIECEESFSGPLPGKPAHRWCASEPVVKGGGEAGHHEQGGEGQHLRRRICEDVKIFGYWDMWIRGCEDMRILGYVYKGIWGPHWGCHDTRIRIYEDIGMCWVEQNDWSPTKLFELESRSYKAHLVMLAKRDLTTPT